MLQCTPRFHATFSFHKHLDKPFAGLIHLQKCDAIELGLNLNIWWLGPHLPFKLNEKKEWQHLIQSNQWAFSVLSFVGMSFRAYGTTISAVRSPANQAWQLSTWQWPPSINEWIILLLLSGMHTCSIQKVKSYCFNWEIHVKNPNIYALFVSLDSKIDFFIQHCNIGYFKLL